MCGLWRNHNIRSLLITIQNMGYQLLFKQLTSFSAHLFTVANGIVSV